MSKSDPSSAKRERNKQIRWIVTIFLVTIVISAVITFVSSEVMAGSSMPVAFIILFAIIILGIVFDIIGVAVTSADEKPFHSMAARKVPGSQEAIRLLRNASRVGSICNDVVGDICGVVSGAASATIAAQIVSNFSCTKPQVISLAMSALAAALTVGGKAMGKSFAIRSCTQIVHGTGKVIWVFHRIPQQLSRKKK